MSTMQGKRVPDGTEPHLLKIGEYCHWKDRWWARCPSGDLGNLSGHTVHVHEDGSITVSPSILISSRTNGEWHGWLERGVWRSC